MRGRFRGLRSAAKPIVGIGVLALVLGVTSASFGLNALITKSSGPAAPVITGHPSNPTLETSVEFDFQGPPTGIRLQCRLDGLPATSCTNGNNDGDGHDIEYGDLATGAHCFYLTAVDHNNHSTTTSFCWSVQSENKAFAISGDANQLFSPGVNQPLNLTLGNPFSFKIKVLSISTTVATTTTRSGKPNPACSGTQNMVLSRQFSGTVILPAHSTNTLSALGVPQGQWPLLQMPNLPINQDACQGTTFHLTYSGSASKS